MADAWGEFDAPNAVAPATAAPAAVQADPWADFHAPVAAETAPLSAAPVAPIVPAVRRPRIPQIGMTPAETDSFNAGLTRSIHDVVDKPAELLARGADYLGLTGGAMPTGDQVAALNTAGREGYEQQYGGNALAGTARVGGQVLATLPVMGAAGRLAGAAGDAIGAGVEAISPTLGRGVQFGIDMVSGTAGGAGSIGSRATQGASIGVNGALQGAEAAALTAGQSDASVGTQASTGALVGGVAAPVVRGLAAGGGALRDAVLGVASDVNPEVANLARLARDKYGINLTLDQVSPSSFVQNLGSQLQQMPGSGMGPARAALQSQFTKAVGRTIGEETEQIAPAVMERAAQRIGGVMENVAANTTVRADQPFLDGLAQVKKDAGFLTPERQGVINKQVDNVLGSMRDTGTLTGQQYQSLTNFSSPLGKALRSADSDVRSAAIDIRHHLDDALERSLPEGSTLLDQLRGARLQYKNLKTIEPLVTKGEPGEISPALLRGRVDQSFKGRGMREAQPDLGELADIGGRFSLRPDSGTAGRNAAVAAMSTLGGAATQAGMGNIRNALYTAATIPAGMIASAGAGAYLRNPVKINRLLSDAVGPTLTTPNQLLPYIAPLAAIGQGRVVGR